MHTTKPRTQDPQIVRGNTVDRYFLKVPVNGSAKSRLKHLRVFSYHINLKKYTTISHQSSFRVVQYFGLAQCYLH